MKKLLLLSVGILFSVSTSFGQNMDVLPQNSQDFINENFSSETITSAEKEDGLLDMDKSEGYEVHFSNGIKLDFDLDGNITEIESRKGAMIPEEAIPDEIQSYIEENYPGKEIESWEMDNDEQEVELVDGTDLEFDNNGNFLKED